MEKSSFSPLSFLPLHSQSPSLTPLPLCFAIWYGWIFIVLWSAYASQDQISNMSHLSVLYFGAARDSQDELITNTNNRTSVRDKYKVMEQTNQKSAFTKQLQTGLCDNMWVCTIEILDVNSGAHTYIHINAQVQVYTQPTSVHVHTDTYHPIIQSQVANLPNNKWVIHTVYCALLLSSVSQRMCAGLIIFNGACDRLHYIIFPLCLRQWALCKAWQM